MKNVEEIVKSRHSVRRYLDKPIEEEKIKTLNTLIKQCNQKSGLHIQLVTNSPEAFDKFFLNYGKIQNCSNYFAMIGKKSKELDGKIGYFGQMLVLKAQELGLNTCWVAGTFSRRNVKAEILDDEKLVCVIALGYGETQGHAHNGKDFEDVSVSLDVPKWYKRGVEFALLAPTAINQQRFKFELLPNGKVKASAPRFPMAAIDLGIVKYNFELGAGRENFEWDE